MTKKEPHPVDVQVGKKLLETRILNGVSQESLGKYVGVTFQQIQKYEQGKNRISASKLSQFADFFEVPEQYFFGKSGYDKAINQDIKMSELAMLCRRLEKDKFKILLDLARQL